MKRILAIRSILFIILSGIALYYEKTNASRWWLLVSLQGVIFVLPFLRPLLGSKNERGRLISYLVEIAFVFLLNYFSRFNINMIFISFYLMVIMECYFESSQKRLVQTSIAAIFALIFNFILVSSYGLNYEQFTQMFFSGLVLSLFAIAIYYSQSYRAEKERVAKLLEEIEQKHQDLEASNMILELKNEDLQYAQTEVVRLTRIAERGELASALHDTVGHEVTGLIMQIEMIKMMLSGQNPQSSALIDLSADAAEHAREVLRSMRKTVEALQMEESYEHLRSKLELKIKAFEQQTQIDVVFTFELDETQLNVNTKAMIYRTLLESMTNTAKHSNASKIWMTLDVLTTDELIIKFADNGTGKKEWVMGNGLKFIEQRVQTLGGTVEYFLSESQGFNMIIKFRGVFHD